MNNTIDSSILISEYIKALILNVDYRNLPKELNLIFDSGGFNGVYAIGVGMYIKALEKQNKIKIKKVSGCSIGALVSLWYLCGCNNNILEEFELISNKFKTELNVLEYINLIKKYVSIFLQKEEDVNALNGRLYISFYDIKKKKQRIVSKFKSKEYLTECIIRSGFIPYISDGKHSRYKKRYIDGIVPYIFKNEGESLFIRLQTWSKSKRMFVLKSENNIHFRLLSGVADANEFFTTGNADICSYVNSWGYKEFTILRLRELLFIVIFVIFELFFYIKKGLPSFICNSLLYNGIEKIIKGFFIDIIMLFLF
jgi:hypothetical protein